MHYIKFYIQYYAFWEQKLMEIPSERNQAGIFILVLSMSNKNGNIFFMIPFMLLLYFGFLKVPCESKHI